MPVLDGAMYVFPTGNVYHADVLTQFVVPHLPATMQAAVSELQSSISKTRRALDQARSQALAPEQTQTDSGSDAEPAAKRVERLAASVQTLQAEFDELIAGDDPLCGEVAIATIDRPFGAAPGEGSWCNLDWSL